jgi:hypothetical protein
LRLAAAAGAIGALPVTGAMSVAHGQPPPDDQEGRAAAADRDFVIAAGMTEVEADCWETIAKAAGQFFGLPEMHPMDKQEVVSAIHIVQNKLLSRPTYRRYLELAKAGHEKKAQ